MTSVLQDLRQTIRQWRGEPGFFLVAVLTIGIGVAGVTTVLSVSDAILFRAQPGVNDADDLVNIRVADRAGRSGRLMSHAAFEALKATDNGMVGFSGGLQVEASVAWGGGGLPEIVAGVAASWDYFPTLGTRTARGRFFSREEDQVPGANPVVVLSHKFWTGGFGGDPSVLGQTVSINRHPFTVIGIAEKGFHGHLPLYDYSLFVPLTMTEALTGRSLSESTVATVGRLAPGSSLPSVMGLATGVAEELRAIHPADWMSSVFLVEPLSRSFQEFRGPISLFLGFLVALSGCILLVASANIAGLLLSRALTRSHEVAVRQAIGAGRRRLVTQLLTETLLLFAVGGGVGVALAFWATRVVGSLPITLDAPLTGEYAPDLRILLVSLSITLTAGMVFGLAPALRATKADVASVLREERGQAPGRHRLRKAFLVAQVAGSVVLMGGSGVLFRALSRAGSMDLGFEPEGVHVATVNLGIQQYSEEEGRAFFSRLLEGGRALPGVEAAALTDFVFLASPPERGGAFSTPDTDGTAFGGIFGVSPEFFETIGTEILEGRSFDATDGIDTAPVAIVNERVAGILWPRESPLGKTLQHGELSFTVIGMAEDSKYISIGEPPLVGVFLPQAQDYAPITSLLLRMRGGGRDIRRQVAELVRGLDPDVPLSDNGPHTELLGRQLLPRRMAATFGGILGLVGLFLASAGLYGLLSYLTGQRSSELAIRIALGAQPGSVRRSVVRTGLGLVAIGLAAGFPLALGISSLIRRFLYGLDPVDPVIIAAIVCVIGAIGLAASYLPALRATRLDPVAVLRQP